MSILNIKTSQAGLVGTLPTPIYIDTNDTYAVVTATGYLNEAKQLGNSFAITQMALVQTSDEGPVWLTVSIVGSDYSLVAPSAASIVTLPTVADHLIVSSDADGTLANKTGTAINAGNLQAGLSGTSGALLSYPTTAASGSLVVEAQDNASGNFRTNIRSSTAVGQTQSIDIPDCGTTGADFLLSTSAAQQLMDSVSFSTTAGIVGTTTNDDADLGSVGEFVSDIALSGDVVLLTTGVANNITSISLTAGDWDLWGNAVFSSAGSTDFVYQAAWISTTTKALPADVSSYNIQNYGSGSVLTNDKVGFSVPYTRLSLAGTTTVYLSAQSSFSASSAGVYGAIYARRAR